MPKSSGVLTMPWPKYVCQRRFTITRAVVGDFLSTSHFAKVRRDGAPNSGSARVSAEGEVETRRTGVPRSEPGSGCKYAGTPAVTDWTGLSQSPRLSAG